MPAESSRPSPAAIDVPRAARAVVGAAVDLAKDATYVGIGFGLLTFQQLQVKRRELQQLLDR